MERFDIGDDDRLAGMVAAGERGEEVQIVRNGTVVAKLVQEKAVEPSIVGKRWGPEDTAAWHLLSQTFALPGDGITGAMLVRQMRDADD